MNYPWYESINNNKIDQGDIIINCPIIEINYETKLVDAYVADALNDYVTEAAIGQKDFIVLTQTCDLENCKVNNVTICPIEKITKSVMDSYELSKKGLVKFILQERFNKFYILNKQNTENVNFDYHIINFEKTLMLPFIYIQHFIDSNKSTNRIRLCSPYREQLAYCYGRYYSRIGLPEIVNADEIENIINQKHEG